MIAITKFAAASVAALALSGCAQADDAAFGAKVRAYLLEHPEVLREAMVKLEQKEHLEALKTATQALEKHREALERDPRDIVINPTGKITVVEFFDYNCAYCKVVAPQVIQLIRENPDVRFVFKEFAFQTEQSVAAAHLALTPAARSQALAVYANLMAQKPLNDAAVERAFTTAGVDYKAAIVQAKDPAIAKQLQDVRTLADALGLEGTPGFIVGNRIIPGADIDAVRAAIAEAKGAEFKQPSGNPS
jgi:protein-disulfide isomerase